MTEHTKPVELAEAIDLLRRINGEDGYKVETWFEVDALLTRYESRKPSEAKRPIEPMDVLPCTLNDLRDKINEIITRLEAEGK